MERPFRMGDPPRSSSVVATGEQAVAGEALQASCERMGGPMQRRRAGQRPAEVMLSRRAVEESMVQLWWRNRWCNNFRGLVLIDGAIISVA